MLVCGDVIRPDLAWMLTRTHKHLAPVMAEVRDPDGFAGLAELAESGPTSARGEATIAATRIAMILACKGGSIADITVGDCVELVDTLRRVHVRGGSGKLTSTFDCGPWMSSLRTPRPRSGPSGLPPAD